MRGPDLMSSRFRNFGFGTKRKSSSTNVANGTPGTPTSSVHGGGPTSNPSSSTVSITPTTTASTAASAQTPTTTDGASSTTSLPMNQAPNGLGRPPSYTYNPNAPRATSPMPPGGKHAVPFDLGWNLGRTATLMLRERSSRAEPGEPATAVCRRLPSTESSQQRPATKHRWLWGPSGGRRERTEQGTTHRGHRFCEEQNKFTITSRANVG